MFRHFLISVILLCISAQAGDADVKSAVEELVKQLSNESFDIRESAAAKLEALGETGVVEMRKAAEKSDDPEARLRLTVIIGRISERDAIATALKELGNPDWEKTKAAMDAILKRRRNKTAIQEPLAELAKGSDVRGRIATEIQNHFTALSRFDHIKVDAATNTALQRHEKTMETALYDRCKQILAAVPAAAPKP